MAREGVERIRPLNCFSSYSREIVMKEEAKWVGEKEGLWRSGRSRLN